MAGKIKRMTSQARNANPLTGLPGNNEIEEEIRHRMNRGERFAVLYCDLDNFKAYNDKYGFSRGDNVILYSANAFRSAVASLKLGGVFLGHEGGDDFVLICDGPDYEKLANEIIRLYDKDIRQFYNPTDQKQGYIEAPNREGQLRRYRFVSVSIGIVTNLDVEFENYLEIISIATDMKKHAKEQSGSSFSANRRRNTP
jgi:diguanylate cyclase (GGDEF)-like protein